MIAILAGVMIATFSNVVSDAQASADMQEVKSSLDATYYEFIADEGIPNALVEVAGEVAGFKVLPENLVALLGTTPTEDSTLYYSLTGKNPCEVSALKEAGNYYRVTTVAKVEATGEVEAKDASLTIELINVVAETTTPEGETEAITTYKPAEKATETYVLKGEITGKNGNTFIVELVTADNYADKGLTEANIGYYTFEAKTEN